MKNSSSLKKLLILLIPIVIIAAGYFFYTQQDQPAPEIKVQEMTVQEKKARFKSIILPVAQEVYSDLLEQYNEVAEAIKNGDDVKGLKKEYKATSNEELLMAIKPHPISLTLAQAAMESSWATSRFFREANNIFGVWSFDENEPRIAAGEKRGDKTIWVKKYASVKEAIQDYYRTLARGGAFKEFRALKLKTNDSHELAKKLDRYSEKGAKYGEELSSIINFNKFQQYDK